MSDKESKNYTIEIILRYKSGEIFRDFEFLSKSKNYKLKRILNKYIYDYFNSYFDDETKLNSIIDEFTGNINMKYDNNYLDVKIIEQILNSNNDMDQLSNYDKDKNVEKIEKKVKEYNDKKIDLFIKDFTNFISQLIVDKFNYKSNKKYQDNDIVYIINNNYINAIHQYIRTIGAVGLSANKIKKIPETNYICSDEFLTTSMESITKIYSIMYNEIEGENLSDIEKRENINNILTIFSIPDSILEFLNFTDERQTIKLNNNTLLTVKTGDSTSIFNNCKNNVDKDILRILKNCTLNTRDFFTDNDMDIKKFLLGLNSSKELFFTNKELNKTVYDIINPLIKECKDYYLNLNFIIKFLKLMKEENESEKFTGNLEKYKQESLLFKALIYLNEEANIELEHKLYSHQLNFLFLRICNIYKSKDPNWETIEYTIFQSINKEGSMYGNDHNYEQIFNNTEIEKKLDEEIKKRENGSSNCFIVLNTLNLINLINLYLIFTSKDNFKFIQLFKLKNGDTSFFKRSGINNMFKEIITSINNDYSEKMKTFMIKNNLTSIKTSENINKNKSDLQKTFNNVDKKETSIFNLFLDKSDKSENYIGKLFSILEDDLNKFKEFESQKKFKGNNYIEKIESENLPKGYNTSEKLKEILITFGKYFDYFKSDENIEEQFSLLERNKEETKKIITYYNIFHILEKLYLPPGTIINDIFYDEVSRQEIKQYFIINKLIPTVQKNELQFIREEDSGGLIKVYFEIDYKITKFNSYIEFNINFNNVLKEPEIKETEIKETENINSSDFIFENVNFQDNNIKILLNFSDSYSYNFLEFKNINSNFKTKEYIIDFIKKELKDKFVEEEEKKKLVINQIDEKFFNKNIKTIENPIDEKTYYKYNFETLNDVIQIRCYFKNDYIKYLKNDFNSKNFSYELDINYIIDNIFLDNDKGKKSFEEFKQFKQFKKSLKEKNSSAEKADVDDDDAEIFKQFKKSLKEKNSSAEKANAGANTEFMILYAEIKTSNEKIKNSIFNDYNGPKHKLDINFYDETSKLYLEWNKFKNKYKNQLDNKFHINENISEKQDNSNEDINIILNMNKGEKKYNEPPKFDNQNKVKYLEDYLKKENIINELENNFYEKIKKKRNILPKDALEKLNINLNNIEGFVKEDKTAYINYNYYKISYEKTNELTEDKYLKQLYEIYDATIFNKNVPSKKVYFDPKIDYENLRYDFDSLKTNNEIFLINREFINSIEDTFLIEKITDYYASNYIDKKYDETGIKNTDDKNNVIITNKKIETLFIDYFFFKEKTDLYVNNSYYNIRKVELIEPSKFTSNKEDGEAKKFKIKLANDFRLKHNNLSSIYQVYLYIKYYKKKSKDEKIPANVIISESGNCMTKAQILDKQLLEILGTKNYKDKFFSDKLLKILNKKNMNTEDNTIKELKKIDEPKKLQDSEEKKIKELNKLGKKNEELEIDEDKNIDKLQQLGGKRENNDIKNKKFHKKQIKHAIKKKYNKKPKLTQRIRRKYLKNSTVKLIKYYLKK
jgi:hypothetical protein